MSGQRREMGSRTCSSCSFVSVVEHGAEGFVRDRGTRRFAIPLQKRERHFSLISDSATESLRIASVTQSTRRVTS